MDVQNTRQQLFANQLKVLKRSLGTTGVNNYLPIYLHTLLVGEKISFNLYIKVSTGDQEEVAFLPFLEAIEVLEASWVEMLERLGVDRFYFHRDDLDRVLAYLNNHLLLFESYKDDLPKEKLLVLVEHLNFSLYRAFNSPKLGVNIRLAQYEVERLVRVMQNHVSSLKMVWGLLYRNYSLYNHSINVCLLGIALMLFMHKSRNDSLIMGMACLFHDIGLTRIPEEMLINREALKPEDLEIIKNHPRLGYQMLQECETLPAEILQLVLEHHENADGTGYPQALPLSKQHPWTRIIHLVNTFDRLTGYAPGKQSLTPFAALKTLQNQTGFRGPKFEPRTLKNFIRFLALP